MGLVDDRTNEINLKHKHTQKNNLMIFDGINGRLEATREGRAREREVYAQT